jgi:DNA polymerase II small subunit/DNA polymerase delta subunit B
MGNLTPKPTIQHIKKKLTSKLEKLNKLITQKEEVSHIKKRYKKLKIRNKAPNCVQKNIK